MSAGSGLAAGPLKEEQRRKAESDQTFVEEKLSKLRVGACRANCFW